MAEIPENERLLLDSFGFKPDAGYPKLYNLQVDEDTIASVDYRKVNGRRFARRKGSFVDDPDEIEILRKFKEEKDKLQSSGRSDMSSSKDPVFPAYGNIPQSSGVGNSTSTAMNSPNTHDNTSQSSDDDLETKDSRIGGGLPPLVESTPPIPSPANQINLYEFFFDLVEEGGIIELFADTGFLKTTTCVKVVCDAIQSNKRGFYVDTEGKIGLHNKRMLKAVGSYNYLPKWEDIVAKMKTLGKYDLLIIDSLGFPISARAAGMKMNEQGELWNAMMYLVGDIIKQWAYQNNAIVIFTNQPKSEMMKSDEELKRLNAVGDKVHFAPNAILKGVDKSKIPGHFDIKNQKITLPETVVTLLSHRIPDFVDDTIMLKIFKQDENVRFEVPENVSQRLRKLKQ